MTDTHVTCWLSSWPSACSSPCTSTATSGWRAGWASGCCAISIGFGKVLWSRTGAERHVSTRFSAIPLGGYVKLLDEREGPVDPAIACRRPTTASRSGAASWCCSPVRSRISCSRPSPTGSCWSWSASPALKPVIGEVHGRLDRSDRAGLRSPATAIVAVGGARRVSTREGARCWRSSSGSWTARRSNSTVQRDRAGEGEPPCELRLGAHRRPSRRIDRAGRAACPDSGSSSGTRPIPTEIGRIVAAQRGRKGGRAPASGRPHRRRSTATPVDRFPVRS
jgi:hypothetical protein